MRLIGNGARDRCRSRPTLRPVTSSARSSTRRCCSTVVRSRPGNCAHSSPVVRGASLSRARIWRRVGAASALNTRSSSDPLTAQLSQYFTTGGAGGYLTAGTEVSWIFHDFPGAFPVRVLEADKPRRIVIEWDGEATASEQGTTRTTFEFEPFDGDTRTLVTITETAWQATPDGARAAFGNCEGWTSMLNEIGRASCRESATH